MLPLIRQSIFFMMFVVPFFGKAQTVYIGTGTSYTSGLVFDYTRNYSASEYVYLQSEIGVTNLGKNVTKIGWYKGTGASTDATIPIKIYMKTTVQTGVNNSTNSTTAYQIGSVAFGEYTLVYDGYFTNDAASGLMEMTLSTPFYYASGNLSILITGGKNIASGRPQYRYSSAGTPYKCATMRSSTSNYLTGDDVYPWSTSTNMGPQTDRPHVQLTFAAASPCSGAPTPGNTISTLSSVCSGANFTLSLQNATTGTGVTYQWQSSPDGSSWSNIGGATSSTLTRTQSVTTYYRCNVTCSGNTGTSNAVIVTTSQLYASLPHTESFESWINKCSGTSNVPSQYWMNSPETGNNSWRRNDQGSTASWSSPTYGAYSPVYSLGSYSARFHSTYNTSGIQGSLDLYVDCSTGSSNKRLTFYYINTSGSDKVQVFVSTNGGSSFTQIGSNIVTAASWALQTIDFVSSSAQTVIRITATADYASTDIGIDNVKVECVTYPFYVDTDEDGYGTGNLVNVCAENALTPPAGYSLNNTDCAPSDNTAWQSGMFYVDNDGDGYTVGSQVSVCYGTAAPDGYSLTSMGTDCDDYNSNVHPNATEICGNGIDDNCDGLTDEGCVVLPPPSNDNPATNTPVLGNIAFIYPNCFAVQGTTIGATVTQQGVNVSTGKKDVWYQFKAISTGVSIKVSSDVIEPNIYLFSGTPGNLSQINSETIVGTNGATKTAILNYGNLTAGQTYRIAIGSADEYDGAFTICLQQLRKPSCSGSASGTLSLCSTIGTSVTGAATTTYNFTGAGSATISGLLLLGNPVLQLLYDNAYPLSLTANYALVDGAGAPDPIQVSNANACTITIAEQPDVQVKLNQHYPATLFRSAYLMAAPYVCGATGYDVQFTPVSNSNGDNPAELETYTKSISGSTPSISLGYAFSQFAAGNAPYKGYWRVRWRPTFTGNVAGDYGTQQIIAVNSTSTTSSNMVLEPADNSNTTTTLTNNVSFGLYPNPNTGNMVNLNITGITSENVHLRIMDSMGRVIYTNRYAVDGSLNTIVTFSKPLTSGLYMVEFTEGNNVVTQRMMVTR